MSNAGIARPGVGPLVPLCLLLATLEACALFGKDGEAGRSGAPAGRDGERQAGRSTERTAVPAPGDRRVPDRTDLGATSPRRRASQRLVEEGKGYAIAGHDAEARERFEEALRLDGSNGEAYFQLAQLAADTGDWEEAQGYHEQAAALLDGRPEWRAPLDDLARRISERR